MLIFGGPTNSKMAFTMSGPSETVAPLIGSPHGTNGPHYGPLDRMPYSNYQQQQPQPNGNYPFYNGANGGGGGPQSDGHITVLTIDQHQMPSYQRGASAQPAGPLSQYYQPYAMASNQSASSPSSGSESDFVTVLQIAPSMTSTVNSYYTASSSHCTVTNTSSNSSQKIFVDNRKGEIEEELTIYRLPGERLGMALRFDGGQDTSETIRRVFVQSISDQSPASKAIGLMLGVLREGDEILQIDSRSSSSLTRLECITLLREAPVCIRLFVRRCATVCCEQSSPIVPNSQHASIPTCCQPLSPGSTMQTNGPATIPPPFAPETSMVNFGEPFQQKRVPPPVPPRMATTTLSSKKKAKPLPIPPEFLSPVDSSFEVLPCANVSAELSPPIEKPPRRKNVQQAGNPPPLPPRRPKGPPPKPPTVSVVSATTLSSASITTTSTKSFPSLVTVITTKVCDVISTSHCQQSTSARESSVCSTTASVTSLLPATATNKGAIKTSATSKVTFTISNSKVSSFIRQTAEKLHRKLSGKTASSEDEEGKNNQKASAKSAPTSKVHSVRVSVSSEHSNKLLQEELPQESMQASTVEKAQTQREEEKPEMANSESLSPVVLSPTALPTAAAIYVDSCLEMDTNSFIESDTDDTSSSVSTIIERSSLSNTIFDSPASHFEASSPYFGHHGEFELREGFKSPISPIISPSNASFVSRVLSPFERLEREFDSLDVQTGSFSLSSFGSSNNPRSLVNGEHAFKSLSFLPHCETPHHQQVSSPNKPQALIADDLLVASREAPTEKDSGSCTNDSTSLSGIHVDNDSRRDYENVPDLPASKEPTNRTATEVMLAQSDTDTAETASEIEEETNDLLVIDGGKNNSLSTETGNPDGPAAEMNSMQIDDDDEDEDFDMMKNDIISRVDDDKDDFMLDTNYLNESSSRYLFHHSGSELILAPYSELSSITEEDEEDEMTVGQVSSKETPFVDLNFSLETRLQTLSVDLPGEVSIELAIESEAQLNVSEKSRPFEEPIELSNGHCPEVFKGDSEQEEQQPLEGNDERSNSSSSSNSSSAKVSLSNVFDFLNEATDDFEFVERMLELTNDKIDSFDDIMRIRESLRGLQQSEQRDNLQRFLDGKDVLDELMALSSPLTHSAASSLNSDSPVSDVPENDLITTKPMHTRQSQTMTTMVSRVMAAKTSPIDSSEANHHDAEDFVSLPVSFANNGRGLLGNDSPARIRQFYGDAHVFAGDGTLYRDKSDPRLLSNGNLSKIPTLTPKLPPQAAPVASSLGKRSMSVSNIFNRSNGLNSLIELRPSLIPRPISNFNLSLPSPTVHTSASSSRPSGSNGHTNCLNRSTSMQSLPSTFFNSLSRSAVKSKPTVRRGNLASSQANNGSGHNYHHNCCRNAVTNPPPYYGSLSRSVSKSTANVYSTGSLPRPSRSLYQGSKVTQSSNQPGGHQPLPANGFVNNNNNNNSSNSNIRTSSLTDLSYGFSVSKGRTVPCHSTPASKASRRHSSSTLFLCDPAHVVEESEQYPSSSNLAQSAVRPNKQHSLRNSSSLVSLLPANQAPVPFWHCSHHASFSSLSSLSPPSSEKAKRGPTGSTGKGRSMPNQAQMTSKSNKVSSTRKSSKSLSSYSASSTSSSSSTKSESDDQQVPPTRSILRHSCVSKYGTGAKTSQSRAQSKEQGEEKEELDYWKQAVEHRRRLNYEASSHSDSESSDITNSSGDCVEYLHCLSSKAWQPKRRNSHKVCFVDEIVQHPATCTDTRDIDYGTSMEVQESDREMQSSKLPEMEHSPEERSDSSSSPEGPLLSSCTSTSSIASLSSSELAKACTRLRPKTLTTGGETLNGSNGSLSKSFYMPLTTQREDSGIFASDDTSPSEFSQSPSPDLQFDAASHAKVKPSDELEPQSMKERIAFFDPVTSKTLDLSRSYSCHKADLSSVGGNAASNGQALSRSSSAPYETHCELNPKLSQSSDENLLLTPPQSPPNERLQENAKRETTEQVLPHFALNQRNLTIRMETTAYPVTFEFKKQGPFSLRDSTITARRFQNTCKLKGLVIPESIISPREDQLPDGPLFSAELQPKIELPTIISEETFKVKNSKEFITDKLQAGAFNSDPASEAPIEIVAIKDVAKYSPMFKRRPLSLPVNPEIHYSPPKGPSIEQPASFVVPNKLSIPPDVPPKPKVTQNQVDISHGESHILEIVPKKIPPPVPPRSTEVKLEATPKKDLPLIETTESPVAEEKSLMRPEEEEELCKAVDTVNPSTPVTNEFFIHQKQYIMRAIVFELSESDDEASLGITLTGGLDSINKEVTVETIASGGLASRDGRLQPGDRIVSINGKHLMGLTHEEAVDLLHVACHSQRVMVVSSRRHEQNGVDSLLSGASLTSPSILGSMPFPSAPLQVSSVPIHTASDASSNSANYKTVTAEITKDVNGLGFIIEGGYHPSLGDRPIAIKRIFRGGPVDKEGSLIEGDELLSVNEQPVQGMSRAETWNFLKQVPDGKVTLVTRRKRYF